MKLIPNWENEKLYCLICGSDKSVKYLVNFNVNGRKGTACVCNACVLTGDVRRAKQNDRSES